MSRTPTKPTALPKSVWPFLLHFFKEYPFAFAIFFLSPAIQVLEVTIVPYSLKLIIDAIENTGADRSNIFTEIAPALWVFGLSWIILVVIARLQNWYQAYIIPHFQASIRIKVMEYLTEHSYQYFADRLSGNLANKVADLARACNALRMKISWNIVSTFSVVTASTIMIWLVEPLFTWILLAWVVFEIAIALYFAPRINEVSRCNAEDVSMLTGTIVDILSNIMPVKLFAARRDELHHIKTAQNKEKKSNKQQMLMLNNYRLFMDISALIMLGALIYFLVHMWMLHEITTAQFVFIFTVYLGVMNTMWYFNENMPEFFSDIGIINQALSLINVPHDLTDAKDAVDLQVKKGKLVFEDVTFGYKENEDIFSKLNVIIEPGQKVGLVGFSGSGKTSFVNLILRFYDIRSGKITIDDINVAEVTQESLRRNISVIPQDTSLFHRTLMENIRYGRGDATDDQVIQASKKAFCHESIEKLPEGYNTEVGERGVKLSGGQRQRIAIARSMLKNAPILILDEATSALDSMTEQLIQESMHDLMHMKTTIVIAHRLSTLAKMDRILVFDNGQIIEDGTHEELVNSGGHYGRMWHMQAGGFLPDVDPSKDKS